MYNEIVVNTRFRNKIVRFEFFLASNLITILWVLRNRRYVHGKYNIFLITDPKFRIIMSENISDKIVNRLVSEYILFPVLEKKLISTNVATRKNRGTKAGIYYMKKYINKLKENYDNFYVLKCDIHKFFYSIDHDVLIKQLKKVYDDIDIINIIVEIINSTNLDYVNEEIKKYIEIEREVILNSSLNKKEKLKIKYYIRYMDDMILFHHDKDYLKFCLSSISDKLNEIKLRLNNKTQLVDMKRGINFLGYRFILKDKKLIIKVKKDVKMRMVRSVKKMSLKDRNIFLNKYKGYFKVANSKGLVYNLRFYSFLDK